MYWANSRTLLSKPNRNRQMQRILHWWNWTLTENPFSWTKTTLFHQLWRSRPKMDSLSLMKDEGSSENSKVWKIFCVEIKNFKALNLGRKLQRGNQNKLQNAPQPFLGYNPLIIVSSNVMYMRDFVLWIARQSSTCL